MGSERIVSPGRKKRREEPPRLMDPEGREEPLGSSTLTPLNLTRWRRS